MLQSRGLRKYVEGSKFWSAVCSGYRPVLQLRGHPRCGWAPSFPVVSRARRKTAPRLALERLKLERRRCRVFDLLRFPGASGRGERWGASAPDCLSPNSEFLGSARWLGPDLGCTDKRGIVEASAIVNAGCKDLQDSSSFTNFCTAPHSKIQLNFVIHFRNFAVSLSNVHSFFAIFV